MRDSRSVGAEALCYVCRGWTVDFPEHCAHCWGVSKATNQTRSTATNMRHARGQTGSRSAFSFSLIMGVWAVCLGPPTPPNFRRPLGQKRRQPGMQPIKVSTILVCTCKPLQACSIGRFPTATGRRTTRTRPIPGGRIWRTARTRTSTRVHADSPLLSRGLITQFEADHPGLNNLMWLVPACSVTHARAVAAVTCQCAVHQGLQEYATDFR